MVAQSIEAPSEPEVVDQVPEPDVQTEAAPQVSFEEPEAGAAEQEPEAATEPEVEEPRLTRAEAEALASEREQRAYWAAQENLRRQSQAEGARKANEEKRTAEEKRELADLMKVEMYNLGLPEADPEKITPIMERYASKREGQVTTRTLGDVADAFEVVAATVLGMQTDKQLSDRSAEYAQRLDPFVRQVYGQTVTKLVQSGEFVHKSQLPELYTAWKDAEQTRSRVKQPAMKRVEGIQSASNELTPDKYAAMTPSQQRALQKGDPAAIDAMYAKYVTVPQKG